MNPTGMRGTSAAAQESRRCLLFGGIGLLALLTGCVNLQAVRSYADDTKKLTAAFAPMMDDSVHSCKERKSRVYLYTRVEPYDAAQVSDAVNKLCDPIADSNGYAAELANTLTDYADVLARLAGDTVPTSLNSNEARLKDAIGKLKDNQGKPLVTQTELSAVFSLAKFVSEQATQWFRAREVKAALNHHEAVEALGNALATYAQSNYKGYLDDERRDLRIIAATLNQREKSEYLAARFLQQELWSQDQQLDAKQKAVAQFKISVDKMIQAHKDLRDNADSLDDRARLKAVAGFAKEVRGLEVQLRNAF
jgi:hypothetical protein